MMVTHVSILKIYFNGKISFGNVFNVPNPVKILEPMSNI